MSLEEIQMLTFLNSVQEQQIKGLQKANESEIQRGKKEVARLIQEKIDYEYRADEMLKQMTDQMSQLQTLAMERIQTLEAEVLAAREEAMTAVTAAATTTTTITTAATATSTTNVSTLKTAITRSKRS